MPFIDVTDVLRDPMIAAEGFTVLRRQETVDQFGRSQVVQTRHAAAGSITPSGDNTLAREENAQFQGNTITVITTFRLYGPDKDRGGRRYQPDIVQWSGGNYVVRMINDYFKYGAGFVQAECTSIDLADLTPDN